jgi:N-acetylmuramoyl-L-alanine amidase
MITGRQSQRDEDIIIALDAGHGGRDPGSIGPKGTYEKHITLAIAKKLQKRINAEKGMRAVLTREGDYYISPSQRPLMAREKKADLLISIHADAFHTPQPRGASVWTINERRSNTEFARLLENKSRQSELLSGASTVIAQSDDDLGFVRTILDMTKEGARKSSYEASDYIIKELKKVTQMHKKDRQYASLAVLTAQDIPSILVEVGFISNPTEEKNLNWSKYRQRLADAIFIGLEKYFKIYPPNGTLWSRLEQKTDIQHVVKSGESLFKIARRYDTSIEHIKRVNNLTENSLTVNQKLVIPRG